MNLILSNFHYSRPSNLFVLFFENRLLDFNVQLTIKKSEAIDRNFLTTLKNNPKIVDVEYDACNRVTEFKVIVDMCVSEYFHPSIFGPYKFNSKFSLDANIREFHRQYDKLKLFGIKVKKFKGNESGSQKMFALKGKASVGTAGAAAGGSPEFFEKKLLSFREIKSAVASLSRIDICHSKSCCSKTLSDGTTPKLSYKNIEQYCENRATYIGYMLWNNSQIYTSKINIQGFGLRPEGITDIKWYSHVANCITLNDHKKYVIDLTFRDKVILANDWIKTVAPGGCTPDPDSDPDSGTYIYCMLCPWFKALSNPICSEFFIKNPKEVIQEENSMILKEHFDLYPIVVDPSFFDKIKNINCLGDNY